MTDKGRLLGLDIGTKRCGLAWTDRMQMIPSVVGTYSQQGLKAKLREKVAEEPPPGIAGFVLGWPLQADGSPSSSMHEVIAFDAWLKKTFPSIPIYHQDEFGSSQEAMQWMVESGIPKGKRAQKEAVDSTAAAVILQRYLKEQG
ncbi:MAG: Holliday junction resolvase RuvX [Bacteroidetes bacterium]|nr:Holliday junction resolvase RuvX [Bacteroidota bacterium]